jgi:hypothetical protein
VTSGSIGGEGSIGSARLLEWCSLAAMALAKLQWPRLRRKVSLRAGDTNGRMSSRLDIRAGLFHGEASKG